MRGEATKVLVTGGAGFIGSHLVRALVQAGHKVRVVDDFSTGQSERLDGLPVELIAADVANEAAMRRAMDGVQGVFHLAGLPAPLPGRGDLARAEAVNVGGTLSVLAAAAHARPRRVVLVSSGAVYGKTDAYNLAEDRAPQPASPEGVQRLAAEQYGAIYQASHGLPLVTLRLFRCFGPGETAEGDDVTLIPRFIRAALDGLPPRFLGDGRQTRDFVYIDNVVAALISAAAVPGIEGRIYNIGSGEAATVEQVWQMTAKLAGLADGDLPIDRAPRPAHEPPHVRVSIARARRDLGYSPSVLLREGLRRTFEAYREKLRASDNGWFTPPERSLAPEVLGVVTASALPPPPPRRESSMRRLPPPPPPRRQGSVSVSAPAPLPFPSPKPVADGVTAARPLASGPTLASSTTATQRIAPPPTGTDAADADELDFSFEWAPVPATVG